jgi:Tat protein translocase TatB subunit
VYLFIFESLGTSELIMIGIVALIFLGPRRLPEIAKKIGKVMADLRGTANEFKNTWEREVDFEEETKALRLDLLEEEVKEPMPRENSILPGLEENPAVDAPAIKAIDKERFDALTAEAGLPVNAENGDHHDDTPAEEPDLLSDKRNWL